MIVRRTSPSILSPHRICVRYSGINVIVELWELSRWKFGCNCATDWRVFLIFSSIVVIGLKSKSGVNAINILGANMLKIFGRSGFCEVSFWVSIRYDILALSLSCPVLVPVRVTIYELPCSTFLSGTWQYITTLSDPSPILHSMRVIFLKQVDNI